eukprot:3659969-Lingulodinium_polyedra.AAC.1
MFVSSPCTVHGSTRAKYARRAVWEALTPTHGGRIVRNRSLPSVPNRWVANIFCERSSQSSDKA